MVVCLLLGSCTVGFRQPPPQVPTYTCCEAESLREEYVAGETVTLRWMVDAPTGPAATAASDVELGASLTGPYGDVEALKALVGPEASGSPPEGIVTYSAEPLHPTGAEIEAPVSLIPLPPTALPGIYDLEISIVEPNGSVITRSVVRVVAPPDA